MNHKTKVAHMKTAFNYADLSHALRRKVGSVIVKDNRIISIGVNGTPSGWSNDCENLVDGDLVTRPEVLHSETNAITKLAKSTESGEGSVMFCTDSPCFDCAKLIYQSGIKEFYYNREYRDLSGVEFLQKCGIKVERLEII